MRILVALGMIFAVATGAHADGVRVPFIAADPSTGALTGTAPPEQGLYVHRGNVYYRGVEGPLERKVPRIAGPTYPPYAFSNGIAAPDANAPARLGGGAATARHITWCRETYQSYRIADNTFKPYEGPRKQCDSPFL